MLLSMRDFIFLNRPIMTCPQSAQLSTFQCLLHGPSDTHPIAVTDAHHLNSPILPTNLVPNLLMTADRSKQRKTGTFQLILEEAKKYGVGGGALCYL